VDVSTFDKTTTPSSLVLVHSRGVVMKRRDNVLTFPSDAELRELGVARTTTYPVGQLDGRSVHAMSYDGALPPGYEPQGLRGLTALTNRDTFQIASRALHVIDWVTTSRFCGRCGERTVEVTGERCMKCPSCGLEQYPRIAPAIIVLVRRGDEALLAHNAHFPDGLYSALAGFTEIGESLEETVHREVREEVGIEVEDVRYFGSQPWPSPHSLMIGFTAKWASGRICVDANEIADARWFSADKLPQLPSSFSVARALVDAWLTEVLSR
jgi:NAD+ diphosphatase